MVTALDRLGILDKIFECASIHRDTKDVLDSATSLIKTIHRRAIPTLQNPSPASINGLLHVFKVKISDEECSAACIEAMTRSVENTCKNVNNVDKRRELDDQRAVEGRNLCINFCCCFFFGKVGGIIDLRFLAQLFCSLCPLLI